MLFSIVRYIHTFSSGDRYTRNIFSKETEIVYYNVIINSKWFEKLQHFLLLLINILQRFAWKYDRFAVSAVSPQKPQNQQWRIKVLRATGKCIFANFPHLGRNGL